MERNRCLVIAAESCLELLFGKKEKQGTLGESSLLDFRLSWYLTRSSFGMLSPQTLPSVIVVPVAQRTFSLIWKALRSFRRLVHKSCPLMAAPPTSHKWNHRFSFFHCSLFVINSEFPFQIIFDTGSRNSVLEIFASKNCSTSLEMASLILPFTL